MLKRIPIAANPLPLNKGFLSISHLCREGETQEKLKKSLYSFVNKKHSFFFAEKLKRYYPVTDRNLFYVRKLMNLSAASRRGIIIELLIMFSPLVAGNAPLPCPPTGGLSAPDDLSAFLPIK